KMPQCPRLGLKLQNCLTAELSKVVEAHHVASLASVSKCDAPFRMQRKQDFLPRNLGESVVQFPRHCGHWPTSWDTSWSVSYPHDLVGLAVDVNQAPERSNRRSLLATTLYSEWFCSRL